MLLTPVLAGAATAVLLLLPAVLTALVLPAEEPFDRVLLSEDVSSLREVEDVPRPPRLEVLLANTLSEPV